MTSQQRSQSTGLKIAGLRKTYLTDGAPHDVLRGLDLLVAPGELVTVIGASGTGKTTLLRAVAGLDSQDAGTITLDGVPLQAGDVSYVFQKPILYPHLSVKENILFGTKLKAFRGTADKSHYKLLLRLLKLEGLEKRRPSELSGGQAQRVGIARALMRKTPVVLFDEPLASVDEDMSASIRTDLLKLHRELGFTGLFITHDQNEALQLGDRVAVLSKGKVAQCSAPDDLLSNPRQLDVALLTGAPKFNTLQASYQGRPTIVGVRATSFKLGESLPQLLTVEVTGRRSLTTGVLYSARTIGEQTWQVDGQDGVVLESGQAVEFVTQLDEAPQLTGVQTLSVDPRWCFAFDADSGKRTKL